MQADQDQRIGDLEQQQSYQQPPPPQAPPPAAAPSQSSAMLDQLNQLVALHQQGVLTDEEFAPPRRSCSPPEPWPACNQPN